MFAWYSRHMIPENFSTEHILLIIALLLVASILMSKVASRFGVPVLLMFLSLGMLAGSEGIGGIYFDNAHIAQDMGIVALIYILFSGGVDANWQAMRPIMPVGISLATVGVIVTTALVGFFAQWALGFKM